MMVIVVFFLVLMVTCFWLFEETVRLRNRFYLKEAMKPCIIAESADLQVRRTYINEITKLIRLNRLEGISIGDSVQFQRSTSISGEELVYLQELIRELSALPLSDEKTGGDLTLPEKEEDWGDF